MRAVTQRTTTATTAVGAAAAATGAVAAAATDVGGTAVMPPGATITVAREAAGRRAIHLTRPEGWPKRQWKNYKRNFWSGEPK
jgi:hypothetical protein